MAERAGEWFALLGWPAAALKCRPPDRFIGWPPLLQYQRLHLIANFRFLILPHAYLQNLASRVLSLNLRRLGADWQAVHGHRLLLAETLVDPQRFRGACDRAANWRSTRGYAKHPMRYTTHRVLIYPLHPKAKELLCDPQRKDGRTPKMNSKASTKRSAPRADRPTARLPKGASAMRIARCSRSRWPLCGAKSFTAVREFAASLTQAQLKGLYARFNRKAARPRGPLGAHPQAGAAELRRRGPRPAPLLSPTPTTLSPWTVRHSTGQNGTQVHLLSAFLHQQASLRSRWEEKTNEIPELKRLLEPLDIQES